MKKTSIFTFLFLLAALLCQPILIKAETEYNDYFFKFVTKADGLAASQVNAICKSSQGYIWFGTSNGLSRFDGYSIINFFSNYTNSSALPDGYIETIQEDKEGQLWIGTSSGYVVFDPIHETFDRSVQQRLIKITGNVQPSLIYIDKHKNMWVVVENKGLYFYKTNMDLVYTFPQTGMEVVLPQSEITGISDTKEGVAIVHKDGTVCGINSESREVSWRNDVLAKKNVELQDFHIYVDEQENIYLYSANSSFIYDRQEATWSNSLASFAESWQCEWNLGDAVITSTTSDQNGFVWMTTDRTGVLLLDINNRCFRRHLTHSSDPRSIPTNNIQALYIDDTNLIWVGTMRFGVAYWGFYLYRFLLERIGDINGIDEDTRGNLWIATRNRGLICRSNFSDTETPSATYTTFGRQQGLSDNDFSCVLAARDGSIWCGSNRFGLNHIKGSDVQIFRREPGLINSLANDNIQALAEDNNGNIWIGTNGGGLQCLNVNRGTYANFNVRNNRLPNDIVTSIFIRDNKLIAGTANGLAMVNLSTNKVEIFQGTRSGNKQFSNPYITQVLIDSRDLIWIGTRDGLNILDTKNDIVQTFGQAEGIPNNMICGLAEDNNKNIWVTTAGGVCRIVPQAVQTGSKEYSVYIYNYTVDDGLQRSEFNTGAICSTPEGQIYMGGANGLNWINEGTSKAKDTETKVLFTGLLFHDQPIRVGEKILGHIILTKDINSLQTLTLSPQVNTFTIEMSVSNYYRCDHPQFIYMLEGYDPQWRPGDPLLHGVRFHNLKPGRYVLHVKAIGDDGKMTEHEHTLELIMERPWWMQWWAIACYILLAASVLITFRWLIPWLHKQFVRNKKERELYQKRTDALRDITSLLIAPIARVSHQVNRLKPLLNTNEQMEIADNILHIEDQLLQDLKDAHNDDIDSLLPEELRENMPKADTTEEDAEVTESLVEESNFNYALKTKAKHALRTIYLVDSDNDIAEYIADSLKNAFEFHIFTNGEDAWKAINEHKPDLVLACEQLSDIRGSELCIRIKQERSFARIPFVLMLETAMSIAEIEKNNITVAADDYVLHFYDLISLRMRCASLLGEISDDIQMPLEDAMTTANAMTESIAELIKRQVRDYVVQNISNPKLPLDSLCQAINVPLPQLFRKLQQLTGLTPAEYIRDIRLTEAANLLRGGNLQPIDVSSEVGFPNLPTFNRFFQQKYGMSPIDFCQQYK
ncbi:MAG: helix-turn-helix domain-containing protein [Bacteroidaceae bacterium]|nr:helix-turn-helix domain-containing protein [Bacteroidaceae bacterium]